MPAVSRLAWRPTFRRTIWAKLSTLRWHYIENPGITIDELIEIIPGPDFPTSPLILGQSGARAAYKEGRGSIMMRSRHEIEEGRGDKRSIVLTSIPFQVGKASLVEKIAEAAKDKRIEGVADIRDESSRAGVRVVIDSEARCDD